MPPQALRRPFAFVALAMTGLVLLALLLPADLFGAVFKEDGPAEILSALAWLLLAAALLWWHRPCRLSIAWALVAAQLALRETGMPPSLFPSGKRLVTLAYYADPTVALGNRLLGGALVVAALTSLGYGLGAAAWRIWRQRPWQDPTFRAILVGTAVLVLSQCFEALSDWLEGLLSPQIPPLVEHVCLALEEGFELLSPLILIAAVWRGKRLPLS